MQRARKRYNVKSKLPQIYSKRTFKRRLPISKAQVMRARCEFVIYVRSAQGTAAVLNANSVNFNNIYTEIVLTHSWQLLASDFLRYKITGLAVNASPVHNDENISDGQPSVPVGVTFYPGYNSVNVSPVEILAKDDCLYLQPRLTTKQYKYWNFPDKYFESSGSGYGIWIATNQINNQTGQISFGCNTPFQNFLANKTLYMLRCYIYVLFDVRRS